jgi:uncharacterized damage-inducible protein DinB
MNQAKLILQQYDLVMHGNVWHGDPIWQILDGISPEFAAQRTLPGTHNIWEIVLHMKFWEEVVSRRLKGQRAGLDEALNFPAPPETSELNWQKTLADFRASNQQFRQLLAELDPARLDELSAAGKRTFYEEAHGLIQHNVYHAGQIALLKKAFQEKGAAGRFVILYSGC